MSRRRILTGRAAEGVGALRRAVTRRHPARVAYLAAGAASVGAALVRSDRTTRTVKPLLMPLLAAGVLHRAVVRGAGRAVTGSDVTSRTTGVDVALVTAGLAGAWAGDVVLMGPGSRAADTRDRARTLSGGAAAFTAARAAHIAVLRRRGARLTRGAVVRRLPVWLAGVGLAAVAAPSALPAVAGYGAALAVTSALAADPTLRRGSGGAPATGRPTDPSRGLAPGGVLFIVSDGLILARLALHRVGSSAGSGARGSRGVDAVDRLLDGTVMATYVVAQMLLVDGETE